MRTHMTRTRLVSPALSALLVASYALTACSDATLPGSAERVSLSFAARGTSTSTSAAAVGAGQVGRITVGSDEIVITKAQLVLKEVELKLARGLSTCGADSSSSSSSSSGDDRGRGRGSDDCDEVEQGPVLVDLPLTGEAQQRFDVTVPAGSYRELELELQKPDDDTQRDRDFRAAHPEFARTSVRVEGTYNGRAFVYSARVGAKMELGFSPPIVVDAAGTNVTVRIDVSTWFRSSSGALIDPQTANAGGANEAAVAANIQRSFEAFGDRDRNGRRDDGSDDDGSGDRRGRGSDDQ